MFIILAPRRSEEFTQLFNDSKKKYQKMAKGNFNKTVKKFDSELSTLLRTTYYSPRPQKTTITFRKKPLRSLYQEVTVAANRYSTVDSDFLDYESIKAILKRIKRISPSASAGFPGDRAAILNTDCAPISDLKKLLCLFVDEVPESATKTALHEQIKSFIPLAMIQSPTESKPTRNLCASCGSKPKWIKKKFSDCYWCKRQFCSSCPLEACHYPRIGGTFHNLCGECSESLSREDASDWADFSTKLLARSNDQFVMGAFGCASIAMALGANAHDLLRSMARELHGRKNHELAYSIISLDIAEYNESATTKQQVKAHRLASSILLAMAKNATQSIDERMNLALASKEAYLSAASLLIENDTELMDNIVAEVNSLVLDLIKEKEKENELTVFKHTMALEGLWSQRDTKGILHYLKDNSVNTNGNEDFLLKAFQSFYKNKEPYLQKMQTEDRYTLSFLKGVVQIKEKKNETAFSDIESAAWNHTSSTISEDSILGACLHILVDEETKLYSFKALKDMLQSGSTHFLFSSSQKQSKESDRSIGLLFPSDSELSPPFEDNWPSLSVVGHNSRCHKKYEEAVLKLYNEKKWTRAQVAWAYIDDYHPLLDHPAEGVVCYLHAAMWIASIFKNPKINAKTFFALKCVTMKLLKDAYAISLCGLNRGMELYVIRLAIGIMRKVAQIPDSQFVFSEEDFDFLKILIKRLEKVCRLFPFWNPPKVSVSEAVMFNIITRKLHSNYVLILQDVNPDKSPVNKLDLKYQLYENDLRGLLPLSDPVNGRANAMDELLRLQGWSWNDITYMMSSRLTPRDSEGWVIQSPTLGVRQQYAEVTGFVIDIDPDHPSVQLLVVEENRRRNIVGLFSQDDINTMLQLESSDFPLFFSLDPPDHDLGKRFHPFQQWRYGTEKVKDSEVLNTMFITDYLMKSFTVGSDVSSIPPYKQRPCKEGLTNSLPPDLQRAIRSIQERGGFYSQSSHRFWIEAKEMKYDMQQDGSVITCHFGEMEMEVKSHSLKRNDDGELEDTDKDDDPNSSEKQFAKDMTEHYEDLSLYFPQFARLRQLCKLQVFAMMLDSLLQNLKESSQEENIEIPKEMVTRIQNEARKEHRTNTTKVLTDMKSKLGTWPKADDYYYVQSKVEEVKADMERRMWEEKERLRRIHGYGVTIDDSSARNELRKVDSEVLDAITKNDDELLDQITSTLKDAANIRQGSTLKQYVRRWLANNSQLSLHQLRSNDPQEELTEFVCRHLHVPTTEEIRGQIQEYHLQKYRAIQNICSRFKSSYQCTHTACKWVPAAICNESSRITYGGVAFTPKVVPVGQYERLYQPRNVTPIQVRATNNNRPKPPTANTSYAAPTGSLRDQASKGEVSTQTNQMRNTVNEISRGKTSRPASSAPSNFRNSNSNNLNAHVDKFIRVTEGKSESQATRSSAGGGKRPPGGGGPPNEPPDHGSGWRKGLPESKTNGVYILRDLSTGKVYVGRSANINRRFRQHARDVNNGRRTVGKHFESGDTLEISYHEIDPAADRRTMQFNEQKCLDQARNYYGKDKVINVINAMSPAKYAAKQKELSSKSG